jgi:two-component system, OmpR family, sensor histidine kinase VanS
LNKKFDIKRKLTAYIFTRFIIWLMVYTFLLLGSFVLIGEILRSMTWYSGDLLYRLFSAINRRDVLFLGTLWVIGAIIIFLFFWFKTLGYLEKVTEAASQIYSPSEELITLPEELKELENRLNQSKLEYRKNERAARDAEQRKNDLVVYLAHDLKTPLTSVIGYLTLLRDEKEISEALKEKYLAISLSKAERLEELINEFFDITRFNLTNLTLELSRVNITRMLEQIVFEAGPALREKALNCRLNAESDIYIRCDAGKMQRVFDNLLRNAINYSFEEDTIIVAVKQKGNDIHFIFINHGNTIPEEKLSRIFEQFYRLDTSRQSKTGGAGLGLAIAKEIVELHQGKITAASKDEVITFEITMPAML